MDAYANGVVEGRAVIATLLGGVTRLDCARKISAAPNDSRVTAIGRVCVGIGVSSLRPGSHLQGLLAVIVSTSQHL